MHVNIRGWLSHEEELHANLVGLSCPSSVALTETWLDKSIPNISLEGYSLVARLDRRDGRRAGGIALFAVHSLAQSVVLVETSDNHERFWVIVHTDHGPLLLALWYRPPCAGEVASITTLEEEWKRHRDSCLGTIIVGDMNVHHVAWLRHSTHTSVEGVALFEFCNLFDICGSLTCIIVKTPSASRCSLVYTGSIS